MTAAAPDSGTQAGALVRLDIQGLRNLQQVTLEAGPDLNLILGGNGAGKTSVLEAVYFLSRARSFRSGQARDLIHHGARSFTLVARLGEGRVLGLERSAGALTARLGGQPVTRLSALSRALPVLLLNPDSHRLLEGSPQVRRRFLDWGVFHGEAGFLEAWRRYRRALEHRNAVLRRGDRAALLRAWEPELVQAAGHIDALRRTYLARLDPALAALCTQMLNHPGRLGLDYRRGWPRDGELAQLLVAGEAQDRRRGHTRVGPHRGDLALTLDGRPAAEVVSRGQQKVLATALVLAQASLFRTDNGRSAVLLVDDLPAELDAEHRRRVLAALAASPAQSFVTAIEPGLVDPAAFPSPAVFRLETGKLHKVL